MSGGCGCEDPALLPAGGWTAVVDAAPNLDLSSLSGIFIVPMNGSMTLRGMAITGALLPTSPYPLPATSFLALSAFRLSLATGNRTAAPDVPPPLQLVDLLVATPSCAALSLAQQFACRASPSPNFTVTPTSLIVHRYDTPTASISNVTLVCTGAPAPSPCLASSASTGRAMLDAVQAMQRAAADAASAFGASTSNAYLYLCRNVSLAGIRGNGTAASLTLDGMWVMISGAAGSNTVLDLADAPDLIAVGGRTGLQLEGLTIRGGPLGPAAQRPWSFLRVLLWTFTFTRQLLGAWGTRVLVRGCRIELPPDELALWFSRLVGPEAVPAALRGSFCVKAQELFANEEAVALPLSSVDVPGLRTSFTSFQQVVFEDVVLLAPATGCGTSAAVSIPSETDANEADGANAVDGAPRGMAHCELCMLQPEGGGSGKPVVLDHTTDVSGSDYPGQLAANGVYTWAMQGDARFVRPGEKGPPFYEASRGPASLVAPAVLYGSLTQPMTLDVGRLPAAVALRSANASITVRSVVLANLPPAGRFPALPPDLPPARRAWPGSPLPPVPAPPIAPLARRRALQQLSGSAVHSNHGAGGGSGAVGDAATPWLVNRLVRGAGKVLPLDRRLLEQDGSGTPQGDTGATQGLPAALSNFTSCLWTLDFNRSAGMAAAYAAAASAVNGSVSANGVQAVLGGRPLAPPYAFLDSVVLVVPQPEVDWMARLWAADPSSAAAAVADPGLAEQLAAMRAGSRLAVAPDGAELPASSGGASGGGDMLGTGGVTFDVFSWCGLRGRNVTLTSHAPAAVSWDMPAPLSLELPPLRWLPPPSAPAPPRQAPPALQQQPTSPLTGGASLLEPQPPVPTPPPSALHQPGQAPGIAHHPGGPSLRSYLAITGVVVGVVAASALAAVAVALCLWRRRRAALTAGQVRHGKYGAAAAARAAEGADEPSVLGPVAANATESAHSCVDSAQTCRVSTDPRGTSMMLCPTTVQHAVGKMHLDLYDKQRRIVAAAAAVCGAAAGPYSGTTCSSGGGSSSRHGDGGGGGLLGAYVAGLSGAPAVSHIRVLNGSVGLLSTGGMLTPHGSKSLADAAYCMSGYSTSGSGGVAASHFVGTSSASPPGTSLCWAPDADPAAGVLSISGELGRGAQGVVYRGVWRGLPVAVKSMLLQRPAAQAVPGGASAAPTDPRVRQAIAEAAISASVSHPNVVATYTYMLQRLNGSGGGPAGTAGGDEPPGAGASGEPEVWKLTLVQELCDAGSLRACLERGALAACRAERMERHERAPPLAWAPVAQSAGALSGGAIRGAGPLWSPSMFLLSSPAAAPAQPQTVAPSATRQPDPQSPDPQPQREAPGQHPHVAVMLLVAWQVTRGLAHLHKRAIVHADVSSANILLASAPPAGRPESPCGGGGGGRVLASVGHRGAAGKAAGGGSSGKDGDGGIGNLYHYGYVAKLCDFGLSGRLEAAADETHLSGPARRSSAYSAPELVAHGRAGPAGDVYALGVVLWELALGLPLPAALARPEGERLRVWLAAQSLADPGAAEALPPELLTWPAHTPPGYVGLVGECLRQVPAERPSADRVCGRIGELLRAAGGEGGPPGGPRGMLAPRINNAVINRQV